MQSSTLIAGLMGAAALTVLGEVIADKAHPRPNIILIMSDDQGWGDVGFNGNERLKTPNLDKMAANGMVMERFYAASPICSPTRGSVLTGRNFSRYGIHAAHTGGMRVGEVTIANLLSRADYATGIFGKWHLGWVIPDRVGTRGYYSPPWHHGFDESFVTRGAVPTWDPTITPQGWNRWGSSGREGRPWQGGEPFVHNGEIVTDNLAGCTSRITVDRVIPFIRAQAEAEKPFIAFVWFNAPHEPVVAGPDYLAMYEDLPEEQAHFFGVLTAMDEQIGRVRDELRALGIADNTLVSFTSDNGAAHSLVSSGYASSGPFRGSKHTPYEGGVRVPTVFEWPGVIPAGQRSNFMASTYDYLPTILDYLGMKMPDKRPLDGVSLVTPLLGQSGERKGFVPIGYQRIHRGQNRLGLIENRFKLIFSDEAEGLTLHDLMTNPGPHLTREFDLPGHGFELYDLIEDPAESNNLIRHKKDEAVRMILKFDEFLHSVRRSNLGADFTY
jgi:arylsulfatase A-like enzyme